MVISSFLDSHLNTDDHCFWHQHKVLYLGAGISTTIVEIIKVSLCGHSTRCFNTFENEEEKKYKKPKTKN